MSAGAFNCDICRITLNCYQQFMQHKTGRKHLNKAKQKGLTAAGNVQYPNVQYPNFQPQTAVPFNQGFSRDTFFQIDGQENGRPSGSQDPVSEAVRQNLMGTLPKKRKPVEVGKCEICDIVFNSEDQLQAHLSGKKHAKKMKVTGDLQWTENIRSLAGDTAVNPASFYCSFCNVQLNSIEQLEQHRGGSKHLKKVENAKNIQDEARLASKLPKLDTADDDEAVRPPSPPPAPAPKGGIPLPPAALEELKNAK